MNQIDCILFDCDGTLVDSEVLCSKAYVHMFAHYGIHLSLEEVFKKYKGVKLYEIIDRVNAEQGTDLAKRRWNRCIGRKWRGCSTASCSRSPAPASCWRR